MASSKTFWLLITDYANWSISIERNVFGIHNNPNRLSGMVKGDEYVVYILGVGFCGYGEVNGEWFESSIRIWDDKLYKYRFPISSPKLSNKVLPGAAIKDRLEFVKEKNKWKSYLNRGVSRISERDLGLIKSELLKSTTTIDEINENVFESKHLSTIEIGDELHERIERLLVNMGFSILESNKTGPGADITIEDPMSKSCKIIVQCKNTGRIGSPTFPSLERLIDEYDTKKKKANAEVAILVLGGYKVPNDISYSKTLIDQGIVLWTNSTIEYYEDLVSKIKSFAKYQFLSDLSIKIKFQESKLIDAVMLEQNGTRFFTFAAEPNWLLKTCSVVRRASFGDELHGYQRLLDKSRITKQIPEYLKTDNWVFPNPIVLSTKHEQPIKFRDGKLSLDSVYGNYWVIDGQHRLYSFANADSLNSDQKILCTLFDVGSMATDRGKAESMLTQIFIDLNLNQRTVNKNLLLELQAHLGTEDVPVTIVLKLQNTEFFKNSIRGYSVKNGTINLTTFATNSAIKSILSEKSRIYTKNTASREERVDQGYVFLKKFFKTIAENFPAEWKDGENYVFKTDKGIRALLNLCVEIISKEGDIDELLEKAISALKKSFANSNYNLQNESFKNKYAGEAGAKDLAKEWSIYINQIIPGFYRESSRSTLAEYVQEAGNQAQFQSVVDKIKDWFSTLEGDVYANLSHIDASTADLLKHLDKSKISTIKIIFSDVDQEKTFKEKIEELRSSGYQIILVKAKKKGGVGAVLHERFIGDETHNIDLGVDLKKQALANHGYTLRYERWSNSLELIQFKKIWDFAERGYELTINWGDE